MAQASGLALVAEHERDAWAASTRGTGELVCAAVDAGAREILVAVGGSATTDGGRGAIKAIRAGGGLRGARIAVLCDVETAFEDAARVFGPQKGADAPMVDRLEARLAALAAELPRDPRGVPGTGAAGGLSGGLWAAFDAELRPGAPAVLDALRVDDRMHAAQLVVAGEGCLDEQSLRGKIVGELARRARAAGLPIHAVVGTSRLSEDEAARADSPASRSRRRSRRSKRRRAHWAPPRRGAIRPAPSRLLARRVRADGASMPERCRRSSAGRALHS